MKPVTVFIFFLYSIIAGRANGQTLTHQQHIPHIYAVVIGVNSAKDADAEPLKYPEQDAEEFSRYLTTPGAGSVPLANIQLLTGSQATRANILRTMARVFSKATADDLVIFYFSEHGMSSDIPGSGYLVPADFQKGQLVVSGIPMQQLLQLINSSKAKMKEVFIDACHAGLFPESSITKGSAADQNAELSAAFLSSFNSAGNGFIGVLSSNGSEDSREDSTLRHGIFTNFLLKGLKGEAREGNSGIIDITNLEAYLSRKIWAYTNNRQHPKVVGHFDPHFPMSVIRVDKSLKELIEANPGILKQARENIRVVAKPKKSKKLFADKDFTYGYLNISNQTDLELRIYQISAFIRTGGGIYTGPNIEAFNLVLPPAQIVESGKIKVSSKFINDATTREYTFFFETTIDGKLAYSKLLTTVDAFKEKNLTIMTDDLDFTSLKP